MFEEFLEGNHTWSYDLSPEDATVIFKFYNPGRDIYLTIRVRYADILNGEVYSGSKMEVLDKEQCKRAWDFALKHFDKEDFA